MQLTGTMNIGKRGVWSMWMTRRVWQTALKVNRPGQQEEQT